MAFLFVLVVTIILGSSCRSRNSENLIEITTRMRSYQVALDLVEQKQGTERTEPVNPMETEPIQSKDPSERIQNVQLSVVGDIMFHNTQLTRAYQTESQSFDFSGIFEYIAPYLQEADLTIGNLETTLHGPYGNENQLNEDNIYGYSGYPRFNTPDSVLKTIKEAGFDFLLTANNHCLDRNYEGMIRTIEKIKEHDLLQTGTFLSIQERASFEKVDVQGIEFAIVNYTYATNGISLPSEHMALVNTLDLYQEERLEHLYQDLREAEESGADYVIAALHFGNEYQSMPSDTYQRKIAYDAIRNGADIILGSHPHVLQPIELVDSLDDLVFDEPKFIIYSLGNFISSQKNVEKIGGNTDLGVVLNLEFQQIDRSTPRLIGFSLLPTYTLWQNDRIMTVPVKASPDLYLSPLVLTSWDFNRLDFAAKYSISHLTTLLSEEVKKGILYNEQSGIAYIPIYTKK